MSKSQEKKSVTEQIEIPRRSSLSDQSGDVFFSEAVLHFFQYPRYGAVVADVISTCSLIELEIMRLAVSQHGSEALFVTETVFKALPRDIERRKKFICAVAQNKGKPRVADTVDWAHKFTAPLFEVRNDFAHGIWGRCPSLPDTLLLAKQTDRLTGQAAMAQLLGHRDEDDEVEILGRLVTGENGSSLSSEDAKAIMEMVTKRQRKPTRMEAFKKTFGNPLDFRAPNAEVWTAKDFANAADAARIARSVVFPHLQQVAQWVNGLRAESELPDLK